MHTCLTYFYVDTTKSTNFDLQNFVSTLGITTQNYQLRDNGCIRIGTNDNYNVDINSMLRTTLSCIWNKAEELVVLAKQYNLTYYLIRVPHVYANSDAPKPLLSLDADIVAFLHQTGTHDDVDYYVY